MIDKKIINMRKLDEIVENCYNAISQYESYLKKHELEEENQTNKTTKLSKMELDIRNAIREYYERDYMPWRQINGDLKEGIKEDLLKSDKILLYLRAEDAIGDTLSSIVEEELKEYYKKNGFDLTDDKVLIKIEEEVGNCYATSFLDSQKYSKDTLELKEISEKFHNVCKEIYKIYTGEYNFETTKQNRIDIEINNGRTMRIIQTDSDKARCGIGIETLDEDNNLEERELISEGDFVMLINYYRYIKENDIKDDFINITGLKDRNEFESELNDIEIY